MTDVSNMNVMQWLDDRNFSAEELADCPIGASSAFSKPEERYPVRFMLSHNDGKVLIQVSRPFAWVAVSPEHARVLANNLNAHVDQLEAEDGTTDG